MKRFLLILLFSVVVSCKGSKERVETSRHEASQEIKKVYLKDTRYGKTLWTMEAKEIKETRDTTWIYSPKIFFGGEEKKTSTLTADSGFYLPYTGDMVAFGNVYVETEGGAKLWTSKLVWDPHKEQIKTDQEVKIQKDGKLLRGKGLISDPNLKHIVIQGKVEGYEE